MKVPIYYAAATAELELPDSGKVDLYSPPGECLQECGPDHWLKSGPLPESLLEFLDQSDDLLVIVNDHFRPTPTAAILKRLLETGRLNQARFLVATALHPHPRQNLKLIFGDLFDDLRMRISVHDAFDPNELVPFGTKESKVNFNRLIAEVNDILTIGSVEPHYFAGFTGGRKIILPGCASFEDVRSNHALAVSDAAQPLATDGNPVWEDIQERSSYLDGKHRYSIQVVTDHQGRLLFGAAGDWDQSYQEACAFARKSFAHEVAEPYDLIIAVVYPPLDRNLYQLQKSYENLQAAVRDGGSILLVSACSEGVGDERFLKIAEAAARGVAVAGDDLQAGMGVHKVQRTRRLAERLSLHLVSKLEPSHLQHLPIGAHSKLQDTITSLLDKHGNNCRVAVVLDSATQVLCAAGA
ncbi:MAG: lactate racemase domain-containing protein [bacterium]